MTERRSDTSETGSIGQASATHHNLLSIGYWLFSVTCHQSLSSKKKYPSYYYPFTSDIPGQAR